MPDLGAWTPADWAASAAWATVLVAAAAAFLALRQVKESRRLRKEQARPYVVAYMESSAATPRIVDFVVKNFGSTAARDVTLSCNPPLRRTKQGGGVEDVWLFDSLPVLVPGQEWRTVWDTGRDRHKSDLPLRYRVVVACRDSRGRDVEPVESVLDWGAFFGRMWVTTYGVHDAAKAVREIERHVRGWGEGFHGGLSVVVRDGDAKDERTLAAYDAMRAAVSNVDGDVPAS